MWNPTQTTSGGFANRVRSSGAGTGIASWLRNGTTPAFAKRLWKRHVAERPDRFQAYVSFPTDGDRPAFGDIHGCIEVLEHVFEGRLDVYARTNGIAAVSDRVPADQFDGEAFEIALERIEACYAETHAVTRLEKWRPSGDQLVKSFVVVPVKPLFPDESVENGSRVRSTVK